MGSIEGDEDLGFYDACQRGNIGRVKYLIEHGEKNLSDGLYLACFDADIKMAKLLLENGANGVNDIKMAIEACKEGMYSVSAKYQNNYIRLIRILVNYGKPDLNIAFIKACEEGDLPKVKLLIKTNKNFSYDFEDGFCKICKKLQDENNKPLVKKYKSILKYFINEGISFCDSCELDAYAHLEVY